MFAYHSSVSGFGARQVGHDGGAEADVALADSPDDPEQKEHAKAPGNCPHGIGGNQPELEHREQEAPGQTRAVDSLTQILVTD